MFEIEYNYTTNIHALISRDVVNPERKVVIGHIEQFGDKFYAQSRKGYMPFLRGYKSIKQVARMIIKDIIEESGLHFG